MIQKRLFISTVRLLYIIMATMTESIIIVKEEHTFQNTDTVVHVKVCQSKSRILIQFLNCFRHTQTYRLSSVYFPHPTVDISNLLCMCVW